MFLHRSVVIVTLNEDFGDLVEKWTEMKKLKAASNHPTSWEEGAKVGEHRQPPKKTEAGNCRAKAG